mgnify:CR=1 FL=1
MTKSEFATLLEIYSNSGKELNIESAIELMQSALFQLMPDSRGSNLDICGSTVAAWGSDGILLKDSEGKLYRLAIDEERNLGIDQDGYEAYYLLVDEDALDKVFNPVALAEFQRLQEVKVAETIAKGRDARRADYERLKAEFEGVSDG